MPRPIRIASMLGLGFTASMVACAQAPTGAGSRGSGGGGGSARLGSTAGSGPSAGGAMNGSSGSGRAPGSGGAPGSGSTQFASAAGAGGAVATGGAGGGSSGAAGGIGDAGGGGAADADAGCVAPAVVAKPSGPAVCGDGYRDPKEECDDGAGNGLGSCSATCQVVDVPLAMATPDAGGPPTLGGAPHGSAVDAWGFATGFAIGSTEPTEVDVAFFDALGRSIGTRPVSSQSTLYPAGTGVALAALGCGRYAAAWTDYGGDSDGAGVALTVVDATSPVSGPPAHANGGTAFDQVLEDMVWTGSELVVVWADDSDPGSLGALKVRTFDASLNATSPDSVLADTPGMSMSAVLSPFGGSWAAAWVSSGAGAVTVQATSGSSSWTAGPLGPDAVVDRPALVDLDATHLLLVYAAAASAADTASLQAAVLDVAAPGHVTPFTIMPVVAIGDPRTPTLTRVGSSVFLGWAASAVSSLEPVPGDVWLKPIGIGSVPGTIDTSQAEILLPRSPNDATGAQDSPVLAQASLEIAPGLLVAAWETQDSGVLVEAIPVPILR